jgi:ribonuclease R
VTARARAAIDALCARHGLTDTYPEPVMRELEAILRDPGLDDPGLTDLTDLPFVTIDGEGARDLDQAMCLAREGEGWRVDYALADASHYVRPGTALFDEALRRGASYYLPDRAIPMLPRALSEDLVSLVEGRDRRALVLRMHLDAAAEPVRTELLSARIRSRRQLTYAGVQRHYDGADEGLSGQPFTETLALLAEVGRARIRAKEARGVAEYDRRETELGLDPSGERFVIEARDRLPVEKYNEQISLLCNIEGARYLLSGGPAPHVQPVFRVHAEPPASRVRDLGERIDELIRLRGLDPAVWRWRPREEDLGRYLARLPDADEAAIARAIHRQAVVINDPSRFSSSAGPHYGIGADGYARFSAPMREIVGVFTHKEALEKRRGEGAIDDALRDAIIEASNAAKELQKTLDKASFLLALDQEFEGDLSRPAEARPIRDGTVLGVSSRRLYVELDAPPLEVKVELEDLGPELRPSPERAALLRGDDVTFAVGDRLRLRVAGLDAEPRRWRFERV